MLSDEYLKYQERLNYLSKEYHSLCFVSFEAKVLVCLVKQENVEKPLNYSVVLHEIKLHFLFSRGMLIQLNIQNKWITFLSILQTHWVINASYQSFDECPICR